MQDLFQHEALPYAGRADFVPSCVSLVRDGLARDERLIILAAGEKLDDVRDELGAEAEDVTFVSTDQHGRNPCRITTMLHSFQAAGDGRHSLGLNETVFRGRSPAAHAEAQLSDFVLNDPSLRTWPLSVVCLYDSATLDADSLQTMRRSHSVIRGEGANADFQPDLGASLYSTMPDAVPPAAAHFVIDTPELGEVRSFVRTAANAAGVSPERVDDLVLAVNEIVTNSLRHGGGRASMAVWVQDDAVVCEVRDRGYIQDPLAGRFAPPPAATSGRGLWLANHLCDLVQVRSSPAGTVVRMYVDL
ncbi:MAG TPA: anti-sigma factor RsbA family regulatory protein [Jatrophihabitans sp.]|jgi:anti-sigma regulatory factor (Ser/Thr protein kinase)|uniref:anti-sigma factor RsbA family regulatory protein n=1 Tax=Jatrophihabitans sp. TaxID=1932789 RepID=UPI002DF8B855|nr:anti-sigma factor RsbA family regulatory protein [Jatrophihabitans sp.]